jgi:hypothetical protein
MALEQQRQTLLQNARQQLVEGNPVEACALAAQSQSLHPSAESHRLMAMCHLLRRDYRNAWKAYVAGSRAGR